MPSSLCFGNRQGQYDEDQTKQYRDQRLYNMRSVQGNKHEICLNRRKQYKNGEEKCHECQWMGSLFGSIHLLRDPIDGGNPCATIVRIVSCFSANWLGRHKTRKRLDFPALAGQGCIWCQLSRLLTRAVLRSDAGNTAERVVGRPVRTRREPDALGY